MKSHGFILRVKVPEGPTAEQAQRELTQVARAWGADLSVTVREEYDNHAMHVSRKQIVRAGEVQ